MRRLARRVLLGAVVLSTTALGGCSTDGATGPGDGLGTLVFSYECSQTRELLFWIDGGQVARATLSQGDTRSFTETAVVHQWAVNTPDRSAEWGPESIYLPSNSVTTLRLTC